MYNFHIIFILLAQTIVFCVASTSPPRLTTQPPPLTPEASCTIANHLQKAISSNPSTPQHIIMEFPSRLEKVLAKPDVLNAADRTKKASAIRNLLKYYSDRDQEVHLKEIRNLKLPSSTLNSFWINNAISITAVPPKIINSLTSIKSWKPCVIRMAVKASVLGKPNPSRPLGSTPTTSRPTAAAPGPSTTSDDLHEDAWGVRAIGAPTFWRQGRKGKDIVVAVIDTGVDVSHESIRHSYGGSWKDATNPRNTRPIDPNGHGTQVTSIIAGLEVGVAPQAKWVACRSMDDEGQGQEGWYTDCAEWIAGLNPLPDIVCNSWGADFSGWTFFNSHIATWDSMDIHHVFAIGNDGPDCGTVRSPGDQPIAFGVGSVDFKDKPDFSSSRGPNPIDLNFKPDISAPGKNIRVALSSTGDYTTASGTSFAAPHVAGAVALLLSANLHVPEGETPIEFIRRTLIEYSRKSPSAYLTLDDRSCFFTGSMYPNAAIGHGILDISEIAKDYLD